MRENIGLYRGKRIRNDEWVIGNLLMFPDLASYICCPDADDCETLDKYSVDPETVGQYTGLTDKNGKKIFEGDIIECWSEGVCARGTVQQNKGGLWIIYPAWQKHIMWGLCPDEYGDTDVEIIGNIHDNPELLEGGADNGI